MAKEVAATFTAPQLDSLGNVIYNGYAVTGANTINKKAWQYKETNTAPINLPSLTRYTPAMKGWTTNYMEYYTQLASYPPYNTTSGDPTMFAYWVNSFSDNQSPGIVTALTITNPGTNYTLGSYLGEPMIGGTGSSLTADIQVSDLGGPVTALLELSAGGGYPSGTVAINAGTNALTGTGTGLLVNVTGDFALPYGASLTGIGTSGGTGYRVGDTVEPVFGTGTGAVYQVTAVSGVGSVTSVTIVNSGDDYTVGDIVTASLPGGAGFTAQVTGVTPTTLTPRWAQVPHRSNQLQVSSTTPPQNINNPTVIQYSFLYPVADSPIEPPIDSL
jgi:hypothetical protein